MIWHLAAARTIISFIVVILTTTFCSIELTAQVDTIEQSLVFSGDLRFRIEHDWNGRRPNGTFRADRSRLRMRMRAGITCQIRHWLEAGAAIRTGHPSNQQDPNITLGLDNGEFSPFALGFHKAYIRLSESNFSGWVGKNSFPFTTQNELFWCSSIQPEGITIGYDNTFKHNVLSELKVTAGHYIAISNNAGLGRDAYLQGVQVSTLLGQRLRLFPGMFLFRNLPNIPDGQGTFDLDYTILHLAGDIVIVKQPAVRVGIDFYMNFEEYANQPGVPGALADERQGVALNLKWGSLTEHGDWIAHLYLTRLERFAVADYFAQNDWARWDYSAFGSPAARLSNLKGIELRLGYAVDAQTSIVLRWYHVQQLVAAGTHTETGSRARVDLNVAF